MNSNLKSNEEWSFASVGKRETSRLTHSYHRYPAKFIPQIVERLIKIYAPEKDSVICDVFGGCGTTLVEAKLSGHTSIGFDINPVAKLITQTKTKHLSPNKLLYYRQIFLDNYEKLGEINFHHNERISYWFDDQTISELDKIYFSIQKIEDINIKRFFLCAFSHNLKNCSRWLMKSIKPTIDKDKIIPSPKKTFLKHLDSMINKNKIFYELIKSSGFSNVKSKMYRRDSTKKLPIDSESIDLIITSPPYVTSYEYADLHQLSLLWFGDDDKNFRKWNNFSNVTSFRKKFVGTGSKKEKNGNFDSNTATRIVNDLINIDKSLAVDVANYFLDMKKVFIEMNRILKTGAKACIIIGDTNLRGVEILNSDVTIEQMISTGFRKVNIIKREIHSKMITPWRDSENGKFTSKDNPLKKRVYQYEYIVIMEKTSA